MKRNVELLERTMRHILDHPEQHDQAQWIAPCGTAACFAGWACMLSGWQINADFDVDNPYASGATAHSPDGEEWAVWRAAASLLGLTFDDARTLFYYRNSRPALQLMVKDLVNGDDLRKVEDYRREAEVS